VGDFHRIASRSFAVLLPYTQHRDRIQPMKPIEVDSVSKQLRRAIETAGIGQNELARRIGLDKAVLSRFVNGKGGLSVASIDAICHELGLELMRQQKPSSKKG
jgi:ribosome-binding protein aMBF1 (putative translation factor)